MIACAGPGFSSANHTINTLRYSDRLKEKPTNNMNAQLQNNQKNIQNNVNNNMLNNINNNNNNNNNNIAVNNNLK